MEDNNCPHREIQTIDDVPKCNLNKAKHKEVSKLLNLKNNKNCDDIENAIEKGKRLEENKKYVEDNSESWTVGLKNENLTTCLDETIANNDNMYTSQLLEQMLKSVSKNKKELSIFTALKGTVDFSVLSIKGYKNIRQIVLKEHGSVTRIINIPENITQLFCNHNRITELNDLPSTLTELYVNGNVIEKIDLANCSNLKKLYIMNNRVQTITNIPKSLEVLMCSNNQIKYLDLNGLVSLKMFHCDGNENIVIENTPENIIDSKYPETLNNTKESIAPKEFIDSVNTFFSIKSRYEDDIKNNKSPVCYGCKKPVGMVFSFKNNKYSAYCNGNPPCDWSIRIQRGKYLQRELIIDTYKNDIEISKEKIIQNKMDILLNYIDNENAKTIFQAEKKIYDSATKYLNELVEETENIIEDNNKKDHLLEIEKQINENIQLVQKYLVENKIEDAVKIQYEKVAPLGKVLQNEKYDILQMDSIFNDDRLKLIQDIHFSKKEKNLGENPSLIS